MQMNGGFVKRRKGVGNNCTFITMCMEMKKWFICFRNIVGPTQILIRIATR
jgi:hypothetical protein